MKNLHLTLKMTTAQVVEKLVTNNSLFEDYPHPDDHSRQITDTPGFKPFIGYIHYTHIHVHAHKHAYTHTHMHTYKK